MPKYTERVETLRIVAEFVKDDEGLKKVAALRNVSDAMEIIGHPRNPKFFPEKLDRDDPSRIKYDKFNKDYREAVKHVLDIVEKNYSNEHASELGFRISTGKIDEAESYLEANFPKAPGTNSN